jgi:hypothetical protein
MYWAIKGGSGPVAIGPFQYLMELNDKLNELYDEDIEEDTLIIMVHMDNTITAGNITDEFADEWADEGGSQPDVD